MFLISRNRSLLALAVASATAFLATRAPAAALTWNNTGATGDGTTWDAIQQNWNDGTNPATFNSGTDSVTFSDTNNGHYAVTVPGSITTTGITATNTTSAYTISIAPGQTLTSSGAVTIGQTALQLNTVVNLTGGGSFLQTGGNLTLSLTNAFANPGPAGNINASGLNSFTYNNAAGFILIGVGTRAIGNLTLANTGASVNSLIATEIQVGDSGSNNGTGPSVLGTGGGSNTIDATTILVGNGKASGTFTGVAGGSLTLAGTTGGTSVTNITVGRASSGTATGTASQFNLAGINATVQGGTVIVGQLQGATATQANGTMTFNTGNFTVVTSLQIGADSSGNDTGGIKGTLTLGSNATSTGLLDVSGGFIIGNNTSTSTTVKTDNASFIMNGGTANLHVDITSANAKPATTTIASVLSLLGGTLNMNGNQIGHVSGTNTTLSAVNMPITGKTATLLNLGGTGINDAGLTVNGGGTLVLGGADSYTNNTAVANSSTLLLDGAYTGTGTINATLGTLGGKGSTAGAVSIASGANLAPGDNSINTLGAGSVSLAGNLLVDLNDSDPNVIDLLNDGGALDISAATSNVSFNVTGTPAAPAYIFAKYGSLVGASFATVSNLPAGYSIDYDYLGQNQVALVAGGGTAPEPASLALLALAAPALLRRRR